MIRGKKSSFYKDNGKLVTKGIKKEKNRKRKRKEGGLQWRKN